MGWTDQYELLVDRVRCGLRRPIEPPEAVIDLPGLVATGAIVVSVERFRLEIDRAFGLTADMAI
jgi:hypothetical protein